MSQNRLRWLARLAAVALPLWLGTLNSVWAQPAAANPGGPPMHALVLGNGDYPGRSNDLTNAVRDAELMQRTLQGLGFSVTVHTNLGRRAMLREVSAFSSQLPKGAVAWVYFAGHGVQIAGENYLIPSDAGLDTADQQPLRSVALSTLMERVATSGAAVNVVVLDACRNNPFVQTGSLKYRSVAPRDGLAQTQAPKGTLVAYSTAPGELAADGQGQNSVYTQALARWLAEPGLSLDGVFRRVADEVRTRTHDAQQPWYHSSLNQELVLLPKGAANAMAAKQAIPLTQPDAMPSAASQGAVVSAIPANPAPPSVGWPLILGFPDMNQQAAHDDAYNQAAMLTADEVPALERQARRGDVVAARTLGLAWLGEGQLHRNNTQAAKWLKLAANQGDMHAQNELAILTYYGRGTRKSETEALKLFRAAAAAGHPSAQVNLIRFEAQNARQ